MKLADTEILRFVTGLADRAHGEQVRKYTGERYIVHPLRVMEMVREFNVDICVLSAALLHDVLEDTPVKASEMERELHAVMEKGQAQRVTQLVIELTDIFVREHYPRLNRRARKEREAARLSQVSPDAQTVKYADIFDNVTDIVRQDADFAKTYIHEAGRMLALMETGHAILRERAVRAVQDSLEFLRKGAARSV